MKIPHCTVTTPPQVEDGLVVFSVVHDESGEAFRCRMRAFGDVVVNAIPRDMTPHPGGNARAAVAEAAVEYAAENAEEFQQLFLEAARERVQEEEES